MTPRSPIARVAILGLIAVALSLPSLTADFKVTAFVRPEQGITDGRPIQLIIQAEGATSPQMKPPSIPAMENLSVVGGPNTNSQFFFSGGRSSSQYQLIYTLMANGPGAARIPAIDVEVEGQRYTTSPIELKVAAAPRGRPGAQSQPPGRRSAEEENHDVFIEAELGTESVWVGQPVALTVTLYTGARVSNLTARRTPTFSNFWVEDQEVSPEGEAYRTRVDGRLYSAFPIDRKLLIPPSPGEFEIEPYVVQMQVRQSRDDFFEMFNLGRGSSIVRSSAPLKLRVRPLPGGEPDGFGGAVGDYTLRVSLDREQAAVNDAVALRATVEGEGMLRAVEPPLFDAPPDLKVFDPKVTESTSSVGGKVVSRKTWEWIVVPLTPGEMELPEVRFPFFHPAEGAYRVAGGGPLELTVERSLEEPDAPLARGEIQLRRREPAFIKPLRGRLAEGKPRVHQRAWFIALLVLPVALVPAITVLGRRRERLRRDRGLSRARRAGGRARKRLRGIRGRLGQSEAATFHEEVGRTLVEYVADRFNRSAAGMTYEVAEELLASKGVEPELRRRFRTCLETCDFARFVPASGRAERREEVLEQASGLVDELERAW